MNRKQLRVMWLAIGIVGLMCLFPPWRFRVSLQSQGQALNISAPGTYRLVFLGPPDIPTDSKTTASLKGVAQRFWIAEIDWARLSLPIFVTIIVSVGLIISLRNRRLD